MDIVLRIIAFLFLGLGAIMVYGAGYVSKKIILSRNNSFKDNKERLTDKTVKSDDNETCQDVADEGNILKIKKVGTGFVIAGVILVLIVFQ